MGPGGKEEDIPRHFIHQDARVSDTVHILRKATVFAHVHGHDHRPPAEAAVGGTADTHVNVVLEISGMVVTDIVGSDEGSPQRRHQPGNAVGHYAVISGVTHAAGQPVLRGAAFLHLHSFGLHLEPERLGKVFDLGPVNVHKKLIVFYIRILKRMAGQAGGLNLPLGCNTLGNSYFRYGDIPVRHHGNLHVADLDEGGGQKGK